MNPLIVRLSKRDVQNATELAKLRNSKNEQVPNKRHSRRHSDLQIDLAGTMAEVAVAKFTGNPINSRFYLHGDNGAPDLFIGPVKTEVKAPMYLPPIAKFDHLSDFKSDLLIVCFSRESEVEIYGGISQEKFYRVHFTRDFGYGIRFCVDPSHLTSLDKILDFIHKKTLAKT